MKRFCALATLVLFSVSNYAIELDERFELNAQIINDDSQVLSGGLNTSFTRRTFASIGAVFDIHPNVQLYVDGQLLRGDNGSDDVGDIQAYSNIDEDEFTRIYEAWAQYTFDDVGLRFKVGQVDANNEFAFADHADEFLNSSMGFSPTISQMPTYPLPRLSMNGFLTTNNMGEWSLGIYSDNSNTFQDMFRIGQWQTSLGNAQLKIGMWQKNGVALINTTDNAISAPSELSEVNEGSAYGYFSTISGVFPHAFFNATGAGWFTKLGYTKARYSEITHHIGAGVQWYGLHGETNNVAGVGFTYVSTNRALRNEIASYEAAIEMFYKFQLTQHLSLKPDLQVIVSPATQRNIDDAIVLSVRTALSF